MKRLQFRSQPRAGSLAVLGLAAPVAAGEQVPFKGSLEGVVTVTPLAPPFVLVFVDATGKATHLGQFTLEIPHIVNRANSTAVGSMTSWRPTATRCPLNLPGKPRHVDTRRPLHRGDRDHHGRHGPVRHAAGSFLCERLFDTVAGTTTGSFEGTIRLRDDEDDD